jgi:hypothetical protein
MIPDWLPNELELLGSSIDDDYAKLFEVFERDFVKAAPATVDGDIVTYNTKLDSATDDKYPLGFTHLVTEGKNDRHIDFDRAKKLPWVRAVLENYTADDVKAFWVEQAKGETLYLWLHEHDFVVVLRKFKSKKERRKKKIIVTAFHVYGYNRRYYQRLLDRAIKVL